MSNNQSPQSTGYEHVNQLSGFEETKEQHVQLHKRENSIFQKSKSNIEDELKKHVELNERHITEMLKTQKEYQQFGYWTCCGQHALARLSKIKSLLFTVLCCFAGLCWSYYHKDTHQELSRRILFYTIYLSFTILCIPATNVINYLVMLALIRYTKDTWKVFYIKGIKNRLFCLELSVIWFAAFYIFGIFYKYDYNENIFAAILCILLSSIAFTMTHLFIRYTALNGYFDIFKIEARKLKTYIAMIEMMANIPQKRKEYKEQYNKGHKTKKRTESMIKSHRNVLAQQNNSESNDKPNAEESLFCIPVMNFLIDFPSENEKNKAKKERKKTISFTLVTEDRSTIEQISKEIMAHDARQNQPKNNESENNTDADTMHENEDNFEDEKDDLEQWLKGLKEEQSCDEKQSESQLLLEQLNKINITTKKDLRELLTDMYNNQYNNQSDPKMKIVNEIQRNILSNDKNVISYSLWKDFAKEAKEFITAANDEDLIDEPIKEKANTDIDEVDEILALEYELYSINLSSNIHTVKIIDDGNLNKLSRVVAHLIFVRLKEFKTNIINKNHKTMKSLSDGLAKTFTMKKETANTEKLVAELKKEADDKIYWDTFKYMFASQEGTNKRLLKDLAFYAWIKFGPKRNQEQSIDIEKEDDNDGILDALKPKKAKSVSLDVGTLSVNIFKTFQDLLLLKQSVDSYTIIIVNLQRMVDVITPLLLLFVYLSLFDLNFEDAMGFYISIVGIIGFFGSSYFSSVFASLSFIMALNPFLVGDIICYDTDYYQVQEISLISCTFKHLASGQLFTFQNKHLGDSKVPIVNLSRCEGQKLKYGWTLYFKHSVTNGQLTKFKKKCQELISKNKWTKKQYYKSLKVRAAAVDEFQRKKVKISMKYDEFNNDVNSICFNYLTQAMTEYSYQWEPLSNMNHSQWFPLPPQQK